MFVSEDTCLKPLTVIVSHDNYMNSIGGVQRVVADDVDFFGKRGNTFHTYPADFTATDSQSATFLIMVSSNGGPHEQMTHSAFLTLLNNIPSTSKTAIIHHAMGHTVDFLTEVLRSVEPNSRFVWAHDFYTLCESFALLQNDQTYCAAPDMASLSCSNCSYGNDRRRRHITSLGLLLETPGLTLMFPSEWAEHFWRSRWTGVPVTTSIVQPARLLDIHDTEIVIPERRIRVAFLGSAVDQKGWRAFETVAQCEDMLADFAFFQMSVDPYAHNHSAIEHVPVSASFASPWAMVDALLEHRIDVAYCFSVGSETFGFTYHEALAAGCTPILRRHGGNPYEVASQHPERPALIFDSEQEVIRAFKDGTIANSVRRGVPRWYPLLIPFIHRSPNHQQP